MTESDAPITREKLAGEVGSIDWVLLAPHARRDALILIQPEVDLVDAAYAIARDDSAQVAQWVATSKLAKPTLEDFTRFEGSAKTYFQFVVIHPYVVATEILVGKD